MEKIKVVVTGLGVVSPVGSNTEKFWKSLIEGKSGTFIAMPSRKTKTGEYKDVAHPINSDFRKALQDKILEAFEKNPEANE